MIKTEKNAQCSNALYAMGSMGMLVVLQFPSLPIQSDNVHLYHFTLHNWVSIAFKMYEHLSLFHLILFRVFIFTEHQVKQKKTTCLCLYFV